MIEIISINILGFLLIGLIIWWFWIAKRKSIDSADTSIIEIIVDKGIYSPAEIKTKACKTITLRFIRKDPSPCASMVVFNDFDISAELDLNGVTDIVLTPKVPGEYSFTCEMAMYQGKLLVTAGCH